MLQRLRHCLAALAMAALTLSAGCGGGGDGGTSPDPAGALDDARVSLTSSAPGARIEISGLPSTKDYGDYEVVFLGAGGEELFALAVEEPDGGLPWILAPLHPVTPADGGAARLQVVGGQARSPELSVDLAGLPEAPGSFLQYVTLLREHIDQRAVAVGTTFDELAALAPDAVEQRLLPLKFAQVFVDDPGHPHSLARIADGTSDYLDADGLDLLDRLFGQARIDSLVQADIAHMDDPQPPTLAFAGPNAGADKDCMSMGPIISTAADLSAAMQESWRAAVEINPDGAPARMLAGAGVVLGAAALVPATAGPAAVMGAGLFAYQTSREYVANTYPSSFVSLDFEATPAVMPEDFSGVGTWHDVFVVAESEGWVADKAIFNAVMQVFGAALGAAHKLKIQNSDFLRDAAMTDIGMSMGMFLDGQPSGLVEFCSQRWRVDVSDSQWSRGRSVGGLFSTNEFREIRPLAVGDDMLEVEVDDSRFGWRRISAQEPVRTLAIEVTVTPEVIFVDSPGEVAAVTATIANAENENLWWDPGAGTWADGRGNPTNGPETRGLQTPADANAFPFLISVESISTLGLRADGDPPRIDTAVVRLRQNSITVSPVYACVGPGESREFTAYLDGVETSDVTWSLEAAEPGGSVIGSISASGVYTAPSSGVASMFVVATSIENPEVRGAADLDAGSCTCSWSLTISTGGAWQGDFASHGYEADFMVFNLNFENDLGSGVCYGLPSGPTEGATGSWPVSFGFVSGSQGWGAGDADGTDATLTVTEHGGQMVGTVSGTCQSMVNGEAVLGSFLLTFRSSNVLSDEEICGGQ